MGVSFLCVEIVQIRTDFELWLTAPQKRRPSPDGRLFLCVEIVQIRTLTAPKRTPSPFRRKGSLLLSCGGQHNPCKYCRLLPDGFQNSTSYNHTRHNSIRQSFHCCQYTLRFLDNQSLYFRVSTEFQ